MLGTSCGCSGVCGDEVEQEAGGQQAQVGRSWRVGVSGVPKRSNGRVRGLRSRWKALVVVLVRNLVWLCLKYCVVIASFTLGRKRV